MKSWLGILVICSCVWSLHVRGTSIAESSSEHLFVDGDIILGGLFNVHDRDKSSENRCGILDPNPGYQYLASALYAIREINDNPNMLRGIKLGARMYDTCRSETIGADAAKEHIKYTLLQKNDTPPLAGVIGPFRSDVAVAVVNLLRVFQIPQVSFGATVVKLSNKNIYGNFLRTVPPNSFQGKALVDVVRYFGWTYVMTVHSQGLYGEPGMDEVYEAAKTRALCIASKKRLPDFPKPEDYENTIKELLERSKLNENSDLNVVILFCIQRDNTGLVAAAKRILKNETKRFVFVASNSWGAREPVTNGNEEGGEGAITLNFIEGSVKRFQDYLLSLNYNSSNHVWFQEFWQIAKKCRIPGAKKQTNFSETCVRDDKLPKHFGIAPVRVAMNAVYAAAYALDNMHRVVCAGKKGMCPAMQNLQRELFLGYLKNVSFPDATTNKTVKFNRNGEVDGRYTVLNFRKVNGKYTYLKVGTWMGELKNDDSINASLQIDKSAIAWPPTFRTQPNSFCSTACSSAQIKKPETTNPSCCWRCENCKDKSYVVNDTCNVCPLGTRPDLNRTTCHKLPLIYSTLDKDSPAQIIVALLTMLGLICTFLTAAFFIKNRNDRVIKASGRELSVILFVGVFFCYISSFIYLIKPTDAVCGMRRFVSSISMTAIYAPVLLRTNRIYRIFKVAQKSVSRPSLISPTSQIIMSMAIIAVQVLITSIWFTSDPPTASMSYQYDHVTILQCTKQNVSVAFNLSLNIILMFIATCYAFLTRNFPRNFNEAKYIGITMYLSCSVWIVFLPCYLNAKDGIWKSVFAMYAFFFIATITLGGLLVPRVILVIKGATVGPETLTMTMQSGHTKQGDMTLENPRCIKAENYEPNGGAIKSKDERIESITSKYILGAQEIQKDNKEKANKARIIGNHLKYGTYITSASRPAKNNSSLRWKYQMAIQHLPSFYPAYFNKVRRNPVIEELNCQANQSFAHVLNLIGKKATQVLTKSGDLVLGGLFPVHKKSKTTESACGVFALQPGYQYMIAMLFALDKINNDSSLLRNISLGTTIYDTCESSTIGADRAKDFIKYTLKEGDAAPLVGVVGPFSSDVSIATAPLLRVFGIPQVSYGSTSATLSNKQVYGNFFRTVPSDHFQAKAIVDILRHFGWNYISTVNSKGNYGERGMEELKVTAEKNGICVATSRTLPYLPTTSHYEDIVNDIKRQKHEHTNVIVLFTTQSDSTGLLKAASALGADRFSWIGSSGWSNRMDVIDGREGIANGSITVNHLDGYVESFERYYTNVSLHMQNPWGREFFKQFLKCNNSDVKEPNGNVSCWIPNMELSPVRVVINAVYAFAHALQDMQTALCLGEGLCEELKSALSKEQLVGYLRNASFPDISSDLMLTFNDDQEMDGNYTIMNFQQKTSGDWDYVNVGEWGMVMKNNSLVAKNFRIDEDKISWGNAVSSPPVSICSKPCVYPKIRQPHASHPRCCWDCISCHANQIILNDSCQSCPQGYRPQANFTSCGMIPQVHPDFRAALAIFIVVLTALGIVGTCLTGIFYLKHLNHPVIKASGRELSFLITLGILLCYVAVFPAFTKPSPVTCSLSRYFGSVCYTFCYAPLLMKTIRIYRIFTLAKKTVARPSMVSPKSQVLVTSGLISIQFLITSLWILSSPPQIKYNYLSLEETVLECQTNNLTLVFNLSYNLILILLCTLFAFKTRGFPRNFNEAKYIGIMMYLTCSIWITFLPSRLNTDDTYVKVYITTGTYFINGTITLIGVFGPKVKVILCAQEGEVSIHGDLSGNSNNKDFTQTRAMNNTSSSLGPARVNRLYSGHVIEIGQQASRTTSPESLSPPTRQNSRLDKNDDTTRNGAPLSLVVPGQNAKNHIENAWHKV
ncbi:uncharacterized protein LOC116298676 [Actinia tenebrosa]|uniref:Uncharacterized protein LOC116298676 n=1 Tax=Actinia tenebrosa TaxID=6105 RepID=A0A6P8I6V8_ACTTE|nr:uncharacterized protein LOC116298676 [Actinia tenebrosa]